MTLYVTVYDPAAAPDGGRRFTDRGIITGYESLARDLFSSGEDLQTYFAREIAPLPPPRWLRDALEGLDQDYRYVRRWGLWGVTILR
jgi:hypothetical protein